MPICFSCGKSCEKLAPTGLCPECSGQSIRQPSIEPSMVGLSGTEKAILYKQRADLKIQEQNHADRLNALVDRGMDGYYEYKVINLCDFFTGNVDIEKMTSLMNDLGLDGWRLVTAYSNDLGVNAARIGSVGINSSVSQNVLIFERFVKL